MCFFKKKRSETKITRQQKRKLHRDLVKLTNKVRKKAERTLNDERIPEWIRAVKRGQLERSGFLPKKTTT